MSKKVVDMSRVREGLDGIEEVLERRPELAERAGNYFAGELPAVEDEMGKRRKAGEAMEQFFIRMPAEWVVEVDDLVERTEATYPLPGQTVTRSEVLRAAVRRGLDALKDELPAAGPGRKSTARAKAKRKKRRG